MAPIAIVSEGRIEGSQTETLIKKNASQYKEQSAGPQTYNKELEEEGSADVPKAKVCINLLSTSRKSHQ